MKRLISILLLSILVTAFFPIAKNKPAEQEYLLGIALKTLSNLHYNPKTIDDSFSNNLYTEYLKKLDPNKNFLTQENLSKLNFFITKLDDSLNELQKSNIRKMLTSNSLEKKDLSLEFLNLSKLLFNQQVKEIQKQYKKLLEKPFNFTKNDFIETKAKKISYAKNNIELTDRWKTHLKYQTMINYLNLIQAETSSKNTTYHWNPALEKKARKKTQKSLEVQLKRLVKKDYDVINIFIDSISNIFDPHTTYLPPEEKENFDINISGKLEGIGALLTEEDGMIKVVRIIPGSAAFRQGELKANDIILKVGQMNEEPVDIVSMRVRDAVKLIRGKKGTEVHLTVKKANGQIKVIPIIRDIVVLEESYSKAYLIDHQKFNTTFGYIQLPSFYRDFNNSKGRNATTDLAEEIKALTKKQIKGLILDLRDNGGGSLRDAIDIAGLFITKGPIVQVRSKRAYANEVHNDTDPREQYKGPLVILINTLSASASEIVAAALQDYNRAIIIGTSSSFGKGTVQSVIDLDQWNYQNKKFGSLKLTIQKFFRVNGDTTQYKGVLSDIILPDPNGFMEIGEKYLDFSLKPNPTTPVDIKALASKKDLIRKLITNSKIRQKEHTVFKAIMAYAEKSKERQDNSLRTLNLKEAFKEQQNLKKESEKLKDLQKDFPYLKFTLLDNHKPKDKKNEKDRLKALKKDPYLEEALSVLNDILQYN